MTLMFLLSVLRYKHREGQADWLSTAGILLFLQPLKPECSQSEIGAIP